MQWILRHYLFLGTVFVFCAANFFFFFVGATQVVDWIGVENTYLIVFLIAAIGGMSSFTSATYIASIATFTAGGADPWLIGITGGIGIFLSDSLFFWLAWYGREAVPERWVSVISRVTERAQRLSKWKVMAVTYFYQGFSPFPSDVLAFVLVISGQRYRVVMVPFLLGSLTFSLIVAHFGSLWF